MADTIQHYSLKIWFKSLTKPMIFPVTEAAWRRFKKAFSTKKEGFFICPTIDGRTLSFALSTVQMVHFLWEESSIETNMFEEYNPEVRLWFLDKDPISLQAADSMEIANTFSTLKQVLDGEALSFVDMADQIVMLHTKDLILLEASTTFVEEGYTKLFVKQKGHLPPGS